MKTLIRHLSVLTVIFIFISGCSGNNEPSVVEFADPFVGTSGDHGNLSPAASQPFSMVSVGPHTRPRGNTGYDYLSDKLLGFSHIRLEGVGCDGTGGNILILPAFGHDIVDYVDIDKEAEFATPGKYSVSIDSNRIDVNLSVFNNIAYHHYTFRDDGDASIRFNFSSSFARFVNAEFETVSDNEIRGMVQARNVCNFGMYTLYFSIQINKAVDFERVGDHQLFSRFEVEKGETVTLDVAFSSIDLETAVSLHQTKEKNYAEAYKKTKSEWETVLSVIDIDAPEDEKRLFYTLFYRTQHSPFLVSTPGNIYRGTDGNLHTSEGFDYYHGWSIWDTFRTKYSLLSITNPEVYTNLMHSLVKLFEHGKVNWAGDFEPTPTVRTEHGIVVLLDAVNKGFDIEYVRPVLGKIVEEGRRHNLRSPERHLGMAYDNWAISKLAEKLGESEIADEFYERSISYREVWRNHFLELGDDADIVHGRGLYEGTIWQYRWFTPHDLAWAIEEVGGIETYAGQLEYFFENELFNAGNQPGIQVPWLFNQIGKPWLTQKWITAKVRDNLNHWYGTHHKWDEPVNRRIYELSLEGLIPEMDEDAGTMSAWYVLSAMGIYPVTVGLPYYHITTPSIPTSRIMVSDGTYFEIKTRNFTDANRYIQSATLNNEPLNRSWISFQEIQHGGKLEFVLGAEPNKSWGTNFLTEPALADF